MASRAFIPVEEADRAISEIEGMVREGTENRGARIIALAALLSVRVQLGLPIPGRPDQADELRRWRRGHSGHLRISRRTDGELDD